MDDGIIEQHSPNTVLRWLMELVEVDEDSFEPEEESGEEEDSSEKTVDVMSPEEKRERVLECLINMTSATFSQKLTKLGKLLRRSIGQVTAGYETWTILHAKRRADYHAYIALDSRCDIAEKELERKNCETRQCDDSACEVECTKCRAGCIAEYHKFVKQIDISPLSL